MGLELIVLFVRQKILQILLIMQVWSIMILLITECIGKIVLAIQR